MVRLVLALLACLFITAASSAEELVVIDKPVVDQAQVMSSWEEDDIAKLLVAHRDRTGVQMAVLTVRTTGGEAIEDYALRVATKWGGGQKGRDDGVLLVFAVDDRRMRLEVGCGIEPAIPDAEARTMLDSVRPKLRAGNYGGAALDIVEKVMARTAHVEPGKRATAYSAPFGAYPIFAYLAAMLLGVLGGTLVWRQRSDALAERLRAAESDSETAPPSRSPWVRELMRWAWLAALLVVGAVTWRGGYYWAYLLVCAAGVLIGLVTENYRRDYGGTVLLFYIGLGLVFLIGAGIFHEDTAVPPERIAKLLLMHVVLGTVAVGVARVLGIMAAAQGNWSSDYSSSSWSSSGTSSSSWSSSSSSSSSSWSSSSSSGSSSSWSGGGGSFGGGGASSSW